MLGNHKIGEVIDQYMYDRNHQPSSVKALGPWKPHTNIEGSDDTAVMCWLILVFAGHTCNEIVFSCDTTHTFLT